MREYLGTVTRISVETFELAYTEKSGAKKHITARLKGPNPSQVIAVGARIKVVGDWAGSFGAGTLTTFTAREFEVLG